VFVHDCYSQEAADELSWQVAFLFRIQGQSKIWPLLMQRGAGRWEPPRGTHFDTRALPRCCLSHGRHQTRSFVRVTAGLYERAFWLGALHCFHCLAGELWKKSNPTFRST